MDLIAFSYCMMSPEPVQESSLQFPGQNPFAASAVHEQVEGEILDEIMHVVAKTLTIEGVKQCVAGSVGDGAGSLSLSAFAKLQRLATKSTLIDLTVFRTTKWAACNFLSVFLVY